MGTVIRFDAKERATAKRTEALLDRVGGVYQRRLQAKEDLPRLLAALSRAGMDEVVLRAIQAWGERRMDPVDILDWVEAEAAVAGLKSVFENR